MGKSLFGLNWCLGISEPSLLVSLDTDMPTQATRACQILAGVGSHIVTSRLEAWGQYLERRNLLCRMYDLSMTTRDLSSLVRAEEEYWGVVPGLVIVDNVSNLVRESDYNSYRTAFIGLQKVARLHGCAVVALHHVKRESSTGALSLHSGQYTGEQEAEIVLGLWRSQVSAGASGVSLEVGVLKNRSGPSDPSGSMSKSLLLDSSLRLRGVDGRQQEHPHEG